MKANPDKSISIQSKLVQLQLYSAIAVLLLSLAAFLFNDILMFKKFVERNLESTSRILAQNLRSTLAFRDQAEADKILSSLQSEPVIAAAAVFDRTGKIFANFPIVSPPTIDLGQDQTLNRTQFRGTHLLFFYPLKHAQEFQGTLYLNADLIEFASEYKSYLWIVLCLFVGGLTMSFVIARIAQRRLSRPIISLARTAKKISDTNDYSFRMSEENDQEVIEEIMTFSKQFNTMLDQIQARDQNIRHEKELAEKANRAKSVFLANISHELRTPMHGILSFARFGQQKVEIASKEKIKSYFDEIHESGSRLMALLNDLLDLSKLEAGKATYTMIQGNLVEVVAQVRSELSAFAEEKKLKIELLSSDEDLSGIFDVEKMMQVFRNILSNAIKFSHPQTVIRIELDQDPEQLICKFTNRGVGIPDSELESIFNKFVQSSKTGTGSGGTGLGLAICKEIVLQHKGKIWAQNGNDGQTTFFISLPKAKDERESRKNYA